MAAPVITDGPASPAVPTHLPNVLGAIWDGSETIWVCLDDDCGWQGVRITGADTEVGSDDGVWSAIQRLRQASPAARRSA